MKGDKKFERLISSNQVEFKEAWDELHRFALSIAIDLWKDYVLREDAIDAAMDKVVDWLISKKYLQTKDPWAYTRRIIGNSLKDSSEKRELEPIATNALGIVAFDETWTPSEEGEGEVAKTHWKGYRIIPKGRFLKVRLEQIPSKPERQIAKLYAEGLKPVEIATELKVTESYISKVLKKWLRPKSIG